MELAPLVLSWPKLVENVSGHGTLVLGRALWFGYSGNVQGILNVYTATESCRIPMQISSFFAFQACLGCNRWFKQYGGLGRWERKLTRLNIMRSRKRRGAIDQTLMRSLTLSNRARSCFPLSCIVETIRKIQLLLYSWEHRCLLGSPRGGRQTLA